MNPEKTAEGFFTVRKFAAVLATVLLCAGTGFSQAGSPGQSGPGANGAANSQDKSNPDKPAALDRPATPDKSPRPDKGSSKSSDPGVTRLKIRVTANDKPVSNAAVYVRFNVPGGLLHRDKLAELDFKTNEDGSVKVPDVPRGKLLIQVVAKGWHTYGKWYDVNTEQEMIEIKLIPPPKWY
jgi:hypothetical protein